MPYRMTRTILALGLAAMLLSSQGKSAFNVAAQGICAPTIDHFEVTQAQQFGVGSNPRVEQSILTSSAAASVKIIDGRTTTVRAYLGSAVPCAAGEVVGQLTISDGSNISYNPIIPDNMSLAVAHQPPWQRWQDNESLNFTFFPVNSDGTDRNFTLTVCAAKWYPPYYYPLYGPPFFQYSGSLCKTQIVTFEAAKAPTIVGVPVNYQAHPSDSAITGKPDSALIRPGFADDFLWATWPFPEDGSTSNYHVEDAVTRQLRNLTIDVSDLNHDFIRKLDYLDVIKMEHSLHSPTPDYLSLWFKGDSAHSPFTLPSFGNTITGDRQASVVAAGQNDLHKLFFSHELGHSFGFNHQDLRLGQVGWDVLRRSQALHAKDPGDSNMWDQMVDSGSTLDKRWIAIQSYQSAAGKKLAELGDLTPAPILVVSAGLPTNPAQPGILLPPVELTNTMGITVEIGGQGVIRLVDATNATLFETTFDVNSNGPTAVSRALPVLGQTHAVQLFRGTTLEAQIVRSAHAPVVSQIQLTTGSVLTTKSVLEWQMSDADEDPLQAFVQYSHDGGVTWRPLAHRLEDTQLLLDAIDTLPASTEGILRVVVSDGLNSSSAQVGNLVLSPNHPPEAHIHTNPSAYERYANVVLVGSAYDLEDGSVPSASLHWTSNIDGSLGTGPALNTRLSVGVHTITLTAHDSLSASSSDAIGITILP